MKLPKTCPVCIIDDQPEEYRKLFTILNRLGVGFVHVAGSRQDTLPESPIEGLRLVFLDMHLGADALPAVTASQTAKVFASTVAPTAAPILVVVWSKFVREVDNFRAELYRSNPEFAGKLLFTRLEKPMSAAEIHLKKLKKGMRSALQPFTALRLLWGWEALAHQAAISTSTELLNFATRRAGTTAEDDQTTETNKLLTALSQVLGVFIQAEAGLSGTATTAPHDLLHALSAMHLDRLDNSPNLSILDEARSLYSSEHAPVSADEQSAMNAMLTTGPAETDGAPFKPGTLFHVRYHGLFGRAVGLNPDDIWKELCQKSVRTDRTRFSQWKKDCKLVLLEITPSCDYAQQKSSFAHVIAGVLVPDSQKKSALTYADAKKQDSRCCLVRLALADSANRTSSAVMPLFSSRFLLTLPLTKLPPRYLVPIARIREPALTDLRNWAASQSARVGYLYTEEVAPQPATRPKPAPRAQPAPNPLEQAPVPRPRVAPQSTPDAPQPTPPA